MKRTKVRTYGRTGLYINLTPNRSKKGRIRRRRIAPTRRIRRDKKRRIRRKGKGKGETKKKRITKRKDPKTIEKRKSRKNLGVWSHWYII
jgi:hypothetical protein